MDKRRLYILIILVSILVIIAALIYLKRQNEKNRDTLTLYGNVDIREVDLGFRVLGRLEALLVEEGDEVKPGQLIGWLDKEPFEDELRETKAKVRAYEVSLDNAQKIFKRREELIGSDAVSKEDFEDASSSWERSQANLEEGKASYASSSTRLRDTKVYCPSEGTVLTRIREPGSIVKVGDPICTVSLKTPVQIRAYVRERDLGLIYPGMPAKIHIDTPSSPVYDAHIGFISPVAEFTPKTVETLDLRTDLVYRLRIIVDNPDRRLRQGMPVTILLNLKVSE